MFNNDKTFSEQIREMAGEIARKDAEVKRFQNLVRESRAERDAQSEAFIHAIRTIEARNGGRRTATRYAGRERDSIKDEMNKYLTARGFRAMK